MKKRSLHSGILGKFIGDRAFYSMVLALVIPMILQDAITSFVGLLDNIMVGQTGTEQMSGVAIANQLLLVYNMSVFGGNGGAGIFAAQFHGKGDPDGVRHTLRYKLLMNGLLAVCAILLFVFFDDQLLGMFLHESQYLEPVMPDIEAMLTSSQRNVTGTVTLELRPYCFQTVGCDTPNDLVKNKLGEYGEGAKGWTSEEAKGFIKVTSTPLRAYYLAHPDEER